MGQYRKKPVVIEAIQWLPDRMLIKDVLDAFGGLDGMNAIKIGRFRTELIITTLEGEMTAIPMDYIIKGIKGEFYPCKPDIFEATYDCIDKIPSMEHCEVTMQPNGGILAPLTRT